MLHTMLHTHACNIFSRSGVLRDDGGSGDETMYYTAWTQTKKATNNREGLGSNQARLGHCQFSNNLEWKVDRIWDNNCKMSIGRKTKTIYKPWAIQMISLTSIIVPITILELQHSMSYERQDHESLNHGLVPRPTGMRRSKWDMRILCTKCHNYIKIAIVA